MSAPTIDRRVIDLDTERRRKLLAFASTAEGIGARLDFLRQERRAARRGLLLVALVAFLAGVACTLAVLP